MPTTDGAPGVHLLEKILCVEGMQNPWSTTRHPGCIPAYLGSGVKQESTVFGITCRLAMGPRVLRGGSPALSLGRHSG